MIEDRAPEPLKLPADGPGDAPPLAASPTSTLDFAEAEAAARWRGSPAHPGDDDDAKALGEAAHDGERYAEAIRHYSAALAAAAAADSYTLLLNRAASLLNLGRHELALADAHSALALCPSSGQAALCAGLAHLGLGAVPAARRALRRALDCAGGDIALRLRICKASAHLQAQHCAASGAARR